VDQRQALSLLKDTDNQTAWQLLKLPEVVLTNNACTARSCFTASSARSSGSVFLARVLGIG